MAGPFQVLRTHGHVVSKRQKVDKERNDPTTLISFYTKPRDEDITLLQFEEYALKRLRVLKGIEYLRSQGKRDAELRKGTVQLLDNHMKAEQADGTKLIDDTSHFALRLAFCRTEDHRRWFVAQEADLFRHRYEALHGTEKNEFLARNGLRYEMMTEEELAPHLDALRLMVLHNNPSMTPAMASHAYLSSLEIYRVPFERVPELVASRRVVLTRGDALVPHDQLTAVLVTDFRERLAKGLIMTAGRWATAVASQESDRLTPIIVALASRHVLQDAPSGGDGDGAKISLAQLPALSQRHFPLCMQHLYGHLMSEHHLRHTGRMQLGLFLKRAGLTLEESLLFWKQAFAPRTSGEKFEKEYAYNVRHSYGKEGRRKDYEAQNCLKIIAGTPGVGEHHGCPFKTQPADVLAAALSRCGVSGGLAQEAVAKAKGGHYQVACARAFEGAFGEAPDAGVTHPNAYLSESLAVVQRRAAQHGPAGGTPEAPAATPPLHRATPSLQATSTGAPTPSSELQTPSFGQFIRTPMVGPVTPQLGGRVQ